MSDVALQSAVLQLILSQTNIVPQTTLNGQALSGATSVTVHDASHIVQDTRLQFADGLGEEPIAISDVTGNVLTLDFTGLGYSGLQHTHSDGATVYTNAKTEASILAASYLSGGDSLIAVAVTAYERGWRGHRKAGTVYHISIYYHRLMQRPETAQMDEDTWFERQMSAARADHATLIALLESHATLTAHIIKLGAVGSTGPYLRTRWSDPARQWGETNQFVFSIDFDCEADWGSVGP